MFQLDTGFVISNFGVSILSTFNGHHIFRIPTRYSRDFSSFRDGPYFKNSPSIRRVSGAYLVCTNFDMSSANKLLHPISLYIYNLDVRELFQHNLYKHLISYVSCMDWVLVLFKLCIYCCGGPGSSVGIATGYGLDYPGIESRWGARFSAPVQTGPGAQPASCTMGHGSFPGV
jgi:hypothetical protein